ncbi:succinate--hydroxymethylglutarate CoA-transferase-like isoform X2 [Gigantopelta aegis]|uniref:succinate--hydroxymethylglutarate CoA-transferase-like isoform X2 n=1 Tax=Gigantopelta aegis TaxID=1735272 RepID=UPI001B887478|nr:succinate--hydroxymethylglutarate CoA-transferase-like isoform X2 [Gigantopelta aegis]
MLFKVRRCLISPAIFTSRLLFKEKWRNIGVASKKGDVFHCSTSSADGPLVGVRVLDLSRILAGPYCTMILGDLGADIIKVEKPGKGCDSRSWGPPFCGTESAYFLCVNRNKKLSKLSDILIENYLPGQLDKMGLGYDHLRVDSPHLIYCSLTGYGQSGPYVKRSGYDIIAAGLGGLMHITGPPDGEPCKVGVAMTDLATGLYAYGSILAAYIHRQKTGRGQHIQCNLLSTQVASLVNIASNYLNADMDAKRYGTAHESIVPYQAFKTSDGYLIVGAGNRKHFEIIAKLLGISSLSKDPRYLDNQKRVANREPLLKMMSDIFLTKTTKQWMKIFDGSGIPYGPINNMKETFSDPQVIHNGMIQEMQHPTAGTIRVPGPAVKFTGSPTVFPTPPPTLGQHTDCVLHDLLGYSHAQVDELRQRGIVQ